MTTALDVRALEAQRLLQNYRRFPVVFTRGEGIRLFDEDGRPYLDFLSGIGVASTVAAGDHGTTYGGNLLACRAALTFLDVVDTLHDRMRAASARLFERLRALQAARPDIVTDVRGAGLIAGFEVTVDALAVVNAALERGLIVNRTSNTVLRLLPPYIVTPADVDDAVDILDQAIGAVVS